MPVYKVNNNATQQKPFKPPWVKDDQAPTTPSAPPWRRQQELKNPQVTPKSPSSPGPKNEPPVFPKPAEQKADVPPPAPGRKQSKITIIPSKPMSNGSSSILAPPPSLPAPPCNPNLAMAPPKPALESKIQVSSKIAEPKKTRNVPVKQESVENVVPIKIESNSNTSPSPPPPVVKKTSTATPKVTQNKTVTRQTTIKEKSPSPPPAKVQQNSVRVPPKQPPKIRSPSPPPMPKLKEVPKSQPPKQRSPSPPPMPKLKEVPKTQPPPKQRTPSPPPPPKLKSALKKTPQQKRRSPSPPPKQNSLKPREASPPKQQQKSSSPSIWSDRSSSPDIWSDRSSSPPQNKQNSIWSDRETTPPNTLSAFKYQSAKSPSPSFWSATSKENSPDIWEEKSPSPPPQNSEFRQTVKSPSPKAKSPSPVKKSPSPAPKSELKTPASQISRDKSSSPDIWGDRSPTPPPRSAFRNSITSPSPPKEKSPSPDVWGNKSPTPPPRNTFKNKSPPKSELSAPVRNTRDKSSSPDIWGDQSATPPPKPAFKKPVQQTPPEKPITEMLREAMLNLVHPPKAPSPERTPVSQKSNLKSRERSPSPSIWSDHEPSPPKLETRPQQNKSQTSVGKKSKPKKQSSTKQSSPPPSLKPKKSPSSASVPPPPPPPMAPPPPPPPPGFNENRTPVTEQKRQRIEALKSRPRRRPDWAYMMKELESGVKLKHVACNDRSQPVLPKTKAKGGQFIYESERERGGNLHHQLLNQIQHGASLKHVKCNDRSRPQIQGLRKFRRQLTIEEQIKAPETQLSEDELDDIDKVRDDLQATKQTLEFELKEKENLQKENRRLGVRILNLEEELDKLKKIVEASGNENALVNALKAEVDAAKAEVNKQELLNQEKIKQMAAVQAQLEDSQHRNLVLEKRIEQNTGTGIPPETSSSCTQTTDLQKTPSRRDASIPETLLPQPGSDEEEEEEEDAEMTSEEEASESESEDDQEEATKAAQEKRLQRELKMLSTKLKTFKEKEITVKNERRALKYQMTNLTKALKVEQKKFKSLQRDVNSMANVMKEAEGSSDDDEEEESEESESEESESESEPESEPDDTSDPPQFRIEAFNKKNKMHENVLAVLKKGNYLLKANIDKLKDDLEKQREKSLSLQEDLNAVLAEIG